MAVSLRLVPLLAASVLAAGVAPGRAAAAATVYLDPVGDVKGAPDITWMRLSSSASSLTFEIRFAKAPPLAIGPRDGWVDMLLIGIDVPPLGPPPTAPGGEWLGANFALGAHGPSRLGRLVGLEKRRARPLTFPIAVAGRTLRFSVPRKALGNPGWIAFSVAAAREGPNETSGGVDLVPQRGTHRYRLSPPAR